MSYCSFSIKTIIRNKNRSQIISDRCSDLVPAWDNIVDDWMAHNIDKFAMSMGAESTGVAFDDVFWTELTPKYKAEKEAWGYEDWLMVRDGDLKDDVTVGRGNGNWYENLMETSCSFGSLNPIIQYQVNRADGRNRQVQFLDELDRRHISSEVIQYLTGGDKYSSGMTMASMEQADQELDSEFKYAVDSEL